MDLGKPIPISRVRFSFMTRSMARGSSMSPMCQDRPSAAGGDAHGRCARTDPHQACRRRQQAAGRAAEQTFSVSLRALGRGNQHDLSPEQGSEQAAEVHRVGDVGDIEFVEAEQTRIRGEGPRDSGNGIATLESGASEAPQMLP